MFPQKTLKLSTRSVDSKLARIGYPLVFQHIFEELFSITTSEIWVYSFLQFRIRLTFGNLPEHKSQEHRVD